MTLVNIAGEKHIEKERPETDVKEYGNRKNIACCSLHGRRRLTHQNDCEGTRHVLVTPQLKQSHSLCTNISENIINMGIKYTVFYSVFRVHSIR